MAVGFELARSNGWAPRGEFAEVPGGTPCRGCAALREELSRLRREGTEARWAANYWRSMHDRSQARARLERTESARLRSASALRELERTASGLRHENVRLRSRVEELEGGNDRLRARNRRLTKERFGRRSERRRGRGSDSGAAARTGRPRGRQAGTASHGRTPRPALAVESETVEPAERSCPRCGRAYVANGAKTTELTEVEVRAHVRRVHRVRRRAACACAPGRETLAPAVPRLFPNTPYGVSVWALFLLEKYAHHRPLRAVSRMLSARGLDLAPGTLADSLPRFVPLFAPLVAAIAERQAAARVAHGDETSWTVRRQSALLAVGVPDRRRGAPARRSVAQRGGGAGVVRGPRRRGAGAPGLRPLRRLRPVGAGGAGAVRAGPMLGAREARFCRRDRRPPAAREVVRTLAGPHRGAVPGQRRAGAALGPRLAGRAAGRRLREGATASGSDHSEKTGNESSTGDTLPAVTGRPNAYVPMADCAGRARPRFARRPSRPLVRNAG